jgi:hypothetical protein
MLTACTHLQLYPDWLAGLQGAVLVECKDLVLPLPPCQIEGAQPLPCALLLAV